MIAITLLFLTLSFLTNQIYQPPPLTQFPPPKVSSSVLGKRTTQIKPKKFIPPTPTLSPTATPKPSPKITESISPTVPPNPQNTIMDAINSYRHSQGLSKVSENESTCAFAKIRAEEIAKEFSHKGFRERIDSKTLPYSNYHEVTENIAQNPNPNDVVPQWIASSGHAANMRKDTPYVCVRSFGEFYAYEGMRP